MGKKSATNYINDNDLEGCYERYLNARSNWKQHWWETIEIIYHQCAEWAETYLLDPIKHTLEKLISKGRCTKYDDMINTNGYNIRKSGEQLCYLFEFFDGVGNLIYSKVGTTTREVRQRLIEEIRSYRKAGYDIQSTVVNRVYNCGGLPAEGLESLIRSAYIRRFPQSFKKNDRFIGEKFDFDYCDSIANDYLMASVN